jgi:hypothetical protein
MTSLGKWAPLKLIVIVALPHASPLVIEGDHIANRLNGKLAIYIKKVMHRGWAYFQARLAFTMAAFNVLVQWQGFQPTASGFVPLSIAEFSL